MPTAWFKLERGAEGSLPLVEDRSENRLFDADSKDGDEINVAIVLCLRESKFLGNSRRFLCELLPRDDEVDPGDSDGATMAAWCMVPCFRK